jgi:hypothetical protein
MQALRIGIVDLDTSHPDNWVPIIKELGHEVVAVFYRGAVLLDKPMAGTMRDIRQLQEWERMGARITGGSSLIACEQAKVWHQEHDPNDPVVTMLAGCSVDDLNYGIHAFYLLQAIMGPGIESVRSSGVHLQHQIEIIWQDGRRGFLSVGATKGYLPFYATIVTESTVQHIQVDSSRLYRSFLEASLPYLAGNVNDFPPVSRLLEAELAALAGRNSFLLGGQPVALKQLSDEDQGYDGAAFASLYRKKARGL